jgi:dolichol-phosphate mannosyltransferase
MKLSIIIPVFNERGTIEEVMRRATNAPSLDYEKEIIVVDDKSTDGTKELLEKLKDRFDFILLHHSVNSGKGAAIKTALSSVSGDVVLIQDADLEYDVNDYENLLRIFDKKKTPIVYGSRNLKKDKEYSYLTYSLGGKLITFFCNAMFGSKLTDINTCYKLFRSDIIKNMGLKSDGFEFCEEVTVKALKGGYSIKEVPINYCPRKFSEGKKIRFKDGLIALWTVFKHRIK